MKLEEFGVNGSDAENVCYLRDIADANRLVSAIQSSPGGNAVVIGGGYIGMECAASLVINKISVTMVFPEEHCSKYSILILLSVNSVYGINVHLCVDLNKKQLEALMDNKRPQRLMGIFYIGFILQWLDCLPQRLQATMKNIINQEE